MWCILQEKYQRQNQLSNVVLDDMKRCLGWIAMLAKPKEYDKGNPNRIIDFKAPYRTK